MSPLNTGAGTAQTSKVKILTGKEYGEMFSEPVNDDLLSYPVKMTEASDCVLPKRKSKSHKYSYGRAVIIGGSSEYAGAPTLAANACERSGAGLTRLMVPQSIHTIAAIKADGAVVTPLTATENGGVDERAIPTVLEHLKRASACVIGPGLGLDDAVHTIVESVIFEAECPLVIDADALTICGKNMEVLRSRRFPTVLTPHAGEFKRIGGNLSKGRLDAAVAFTQQYPNIVLILKGCGTLIGYRGEITVNPTGSPAMAKGGSGDVLSGILCGLLAQGFAPAEAAKSAVYLHGLAGDLAKKEFGEYSVTPGDLIRALPEAFKSITESKTGVWPENDNL